MILVRGDQVGDGANDAKRRPSENGKGELVFPQRQTLVVGQRLLAQDDRDQGGGCGKGAACRSIGGRKSMVSGKDEQGSPMADAHQRTNQSQTDRRRASRYPKLSGFRSPS